MIDEVQLKPSLFPLLRVLMDRQLQPWHEALSKRQVKAPKIYFRDTGLLHFLMGVQGLPKLLAHSHSGAGLKGFALEQVLRIAKPDRS